ncbi:hypothetical protein [Halochromatium sp.]
MSDSHLLILQRRASRLGADPAPLPRASAQSQCPEPVPRASAQRQCPAPLLALKSAPVSV